MKLRGVVAVSYTVARRMNLCLLALCLALFLVSPVFAKSSSPSKAHLNMQPPKAKPYLKRQVARMSLVRDYKFAGLIGEAEGGVLKIRSLKKVKKADKKKVMDLVKNENKDRKRIMVEIIRYNKLSKVDRGHLIKSFYTINKNTSAKGTYYYERKTWTRKH